jgi:hypothetical protein
VNRFVILGLLALSVSWSSFAHGEAELGSKRSFFVWDLNVMPPGSRVAEATLMAKGLRSYLYVENSRLSLPPGFIERTISTLESQTPPGSLRSDWGIVPLLESVFAPLPKVVSPDDHLIVLMADLGKYKNFEFDGFFNAFDQMSPEKAAEFDQKTNQSNIIYINGLRKNEDYTLGVIAHELQHLLHFHAPKKEGFIQSTWLSETLAEAAMLVTGFFTDQGHVDRFALNSFRHSLTPKKYVQYGPQLLFAAYLMDSPQVGIAGLKILTESTREGRSAVEQVFDANAPFFLPFDLVFGNFVNYVFHNAGKRVPVVSTTTPDTGILIPEIPSYLRLASIPAIAEGMVMPYGFAPIDLPFPLPPDAIVISEAIRSGAAPDRCGAIADVLWKPINPQRIVVYAVGCEPDGEADFVRFRLTIQEGSLVP